VGEGAGEEPGVDDDGDVDDDGEVEDGEVDDGEVDGGEVDGDGDIEGVGEGVGASGRGWSTGSTVAPPE
jgi:hypothetical protein